MNGNSENRAVIREETIVKNNNKRRKLSIPLNFISINFNLINFIHDICVSNKPYDVRNYD